MPFLREYQILREPLVDGCHRFLSGAGRDGEEEDIPRGDGLDLAELRGSGVPEGVVTALTLEHDASTLLRIAVQPFLGHMVCIDGEPVRVTDSPESKVHHERGRLTLRL
jgi:hypothetical protein